MFIRFAKESVERKAVTHEKIREMRRAAHADVKEAFANVKAAHGSRPKGNKPRCGEFYTGLSQKLTSALLSDSVFKYGKAEDYGIAG